MLHYEEDTVSSDKIFAYVYSVAPAGGKMWISADAGVTWTQESYPAGTTICFGAVYAAGVVWGLFQTAVATYHLYERTSANTWADRGVAGFAGTAPFKSIVQGGHWYVGADNGDFYKIELGADYTITLIYDAPATAMLILPIRRSANMWFASFLNSATLILSLMYSTDQGANWSACACNADNWLVLWVDASYVYVTYYDTTKTMLHVGRFADKDSTTITSLYYSEETATSYYNCGITSRTIGTNYKVVFGWKQNATASSYSNFICTYLNVGDYITRCEIENSLNPAEPRRCEIDSISDVINGFCPDLIYTIQDSGAVEKFKGKLLEKTADGKTVILYGVESEAFTITASAKHAAKTAHEIIDAQLAKLVNTASGTIDASAATTYTQTYTDATQVMYALITWAFIGLGIIRVNQSSQIDFKLLAGLDASGRTLAPGTDYSKITQIDEQNSAKFDKLIVIGTGDSAGILQKTLGSGDNPKTVSRPEFTDQNAVVNFCTQLYALICSTNQISRIYTVEEWESVWMEVGDTVGGSEDLPYATYIILKSKYDLCSDHATWRLSQILEIAQFFESKQNSDVGYGLVDSAGGTALADINTLQDLFLGILTKTGLKVNTLFQILATGKLATAIDMDSHKINNLTDGAAAQDAVSKAQLDLKAPLVDPVFTNLAYMGTNNKYFYFKDSAGNYTSYFLLSSSDAFYMKNTKAGESIIIDSTLGVLLAINNATKVTLVATDMSADVNIRPATDNTYYLGKNDDDSPLAWKGLILKDQGGTGKYYRLEVFGDALRIVDLTD